MLPVVCMDELSKQLIGETRVPIPMSKEHDRKCDYEYERYELAEAKRNPPASFYRLFRY